jgi:hypothetical protein
LSTRSRRKKNDANKSTSEEDNVRRSIAGNVDRRDPSDHAQQGVMRRRNGHLDTLEKEKEEIDGLAEKGDEEAISDHGQIRV